MKTSFVIFTVVTGLVSLGSLCFGDDFVEPGRFGVEGTISTTGSSAGFQTGFVREADGYEAAIDLDGSTATSGGVKTGDIGVEVRAGKRFNIGSYNYLSVGADATTSLFSVTGGTNTNGAYSVGPYVGFQRHFSGTSLMLQIYVLPVNYVYTPASGTATGSSNQAWQFMQAGSFGVAYLF